MTSTISAGSRAAPPTVHESAAVTQDEIAVLHAMLEQQRDFRIEQLAQLHRPGPHGPLSSTDDEVFRSLSSGARAALRDVQAALWRIEEGRYGVCTSCAAPVEFGRLEILPQVARCMSCERHDAAVRDAC